MRGLANGHYTPISECIQYVHQKPGGKRQTTDRLRTQSEVLHPESVLPVPEDAEDCRPVLGGDGRGGRPRALQRPGGSRLGGQRRGPGGIRPHRIVRLQPVQLPAVSVPVRVGPIDDRHGPLADPGPARPHRRAGGHDIPHAVGPECPGCLVGLRRRHVQRRPLHRRDQQRQRQRQLRQLGGIDQRPRRHQAVAEHGGRHDLEGHALRPFPSTTSSLSSTRRWPAKWPSRRKSSIT